MPRSQREPAMTPVFPERTNLAQYFLFDRLCEGLGAKTAIVFGDRKFTYAEVARQARAFSGALRAADIRRGERVLIILPDLPAFAFVFFGTLARGCVVAMANPDAPVDALRYLVDYTGATAVVTLPRVASALAGAVRAGSTGAELRRVWLVEDEKAFSPSAADSSRAFEDGIFRPLAADLSAIDLPEATCDTHRDEPAIWLFTSGSTGEPKANIHTHRDFAFNTEVYAKRTVGYRESDVTVSVPRLYFGYATGTNLMFPFAVGATTALFSERATPETLATAIERYKPTVITNVPTMIGKLLEHDHHERAKGGKGLDMSSVRFSLSAGEALPDALLSRLLERFKSDVYDGIGSAEMFHIYASNRPGDIKPGSLGKVVEGYELKILPEDAEGPGAAPCCARGDRRPVGQGRQRLPGLLARSRQELEDVPRALVQDGRPLSRRRGGLSLLRGPRGRAPQGERPVGGTGRGRGVHDAARRGRAGGGHRRGRRRAPQDQGLRRPPGRRKPEPRRDRQGAPGVREGSPLQAQVPAHHRVRRRRAEE